MARKKSEHAAAAARRRVPLWLPAVGLVIVLAGIAVAAVILSRQQAGGGGGSASAGDVKKVVGKWVRPDGGYVIEIKTVGEDGKLEATYANPSPIKVARAEAKYEGGKVGVYVELRDEGYPGSNYRLVYDPGADRMAGVYHQLGTGQQYSVGFERMRE